MTKDVNTFSIHDLLMIWKYFYSHILQNIEAIFTEVKPIDGSIRQAVLVCFRDEVILPLSNELKQYMADLMSIEQQQLYSLRHMFLVLQVSLRSIAMFAIAICVLLQCSFLHGLESFRKTKF